MKRRRGVTYTVIVLLSSALLLAIGGAFVDSSRNLVKLTGLLEQKTRAAEALAGAAAWARCAVASGATTGKSTLELSRAKVEVELRPDGDAFFMDAVARTEDFSQRARAAIARRDGRWVVTRFELAGPFAGEPDKARPDKGTGSKFR
jgi:hypothetical protein